MAVHWQMENAMGKTYAEKMIPGLSNGIFIHYNVIIMNQLNDVYKSKVLYIIKETLHCEKSKLFVYKR